MNEADFRPFHCPEHGQFLVRSNLVRGETLPPCPFCGATSFLPSEAKKIQKAKQQRPEEPAPKAEPAEVESGLIYPGDGGKWLRIEMPSNIKAGKIYMREKYSQLRKDRMKRVRMLRNYLEG